jgi:hypothetical protein
MFSRYCGSSRWAFHAFVDPRVESWGVQSSNGEHCMHSSSIPGSPIIRRVEIERWLHPNFGAAHIRPQFTALRLTMVPRFVSRRVEVWEERGFARTVRSVGIPMRQNTYYDSYSRLSEGSEQSTKRTEIRECLWVCDLVERARLQSKKLKYKIITGTILMNYGNLPG